jgi:hypothetical protein
MRDEVRRFNAPEMRACRARLARTLLASRRDFATIEEDGGEEVCADFEDVGLLRRRRVLPAYYVWPMPSEETLMGIRFGLWPRPHEHRISSPPAYLMQCSTRRGGRG